MHIQLTPPKMAKPNKQIAEKVKLIEQIKQAQTIEDLADILIRIVENLPRVK